MSKITLNAKCPFRFETIELDFQPDNINIKYQDREFILSYERIIREKQKLQGVNDEN